MATQDTIDPVMQIFQLSPFGILFFNSSERITWANNKVEDYFGQPATELIGKSMDNLSGDGIKLSFERQDIIQVMSDREIWLKRYSQPLDPAVDSAIKVEYLIDITEYVNLQTERDRLVARLQDMMAVDPNSGLLTRKAMLQNLDLLVSRSRRYGNPLSVSIMEVTSPESPNQESPSQKSQGHQAPVAEVMIAVGQLLKDQMRWADLINRDKKSIFTLVLPETSQDATLQMIRKIAAHLDKLPVPYDEGHKVTVKAHFGVASWQRHDDANMLLQRAEENLQATKAKAKN